jgi:hypothetical protein
VDVGLDQVLPDQELAIKELLVRDAGEVVAERGQRPARPLRVLRGRPNEDVDVESRPGVPWTGKAVAPIRT